MLTIKWTKSCKVNFSVSIFVEDSTVKVWDVHSGQNLYTLQHDGPISCMQLHSDSSILISGSDDSTMKSWNIHFLFIDWFVNYYLILIFRFLFDLVIHIKTGECIHTYNNHTDIVLCLDWNGDILASGACDSMLGVWDVPSGQLRYPNS